MDTQHTIDTCNELLRGELSAAETYGIVLKKFADADSLATLRNIQKEHLNNCVMLEETITKLGGEPSKDSGYWGTFAKSVTSCTSLLGENAALAVLKQGEEHGKSQYEKAINRDEVADPCQEMISTHLLPNTVKHISLLEAM